MHCSKSLLAIYRIYKMSNVAPLFFIAIKHFHRKTPAMPKSSLQVLVTEQKILNKIYVMRSEKVMLNEDLSLLLKPSN